MTLLVLISQRVVVVIVKDVLETRNGVTTIGTVIKTEVKAINLTMRAKSGLILLVMFTLALAGCGEVFFQESKTIPNKIWEQGSNFSFDVTVTDTMTGYDFYIDLRNDASYPYANVYMFVTTTFPSGKSARDTVECFLADKTGRWLGTGLGDVLDNHILFKENIRFPNTGTYRFEFEHGMRKEALPSVLDLGISLEKHRKR